MHAVNNESLLNGIFTDHLMESVIKLVNSLRIRFELESIIKTILKNERILRSHGVVRFSWIFFNIQKIFNNRYRFCPLSNHE